MAQFDNVTHLEKCGTFEKMWRILEIVVHFKNCGAFNLEKLEIVPHLKKMWRIWKNGAHLEKRGALRKLWRIKKNAAHF